MKTMIRLSMLAAALMLTAVARGQEASSTVKLTLEDMHTIKEIVLKDYNFPRSKAAELEPGDAAPPDASLQSFPEPVTSKIPATRPLKFFLSGDRIVIVSGSDNRVAEIIK